jgi:hypothetical protein
LMHLKKHKQVNVMLLKIHLRLVRDMRVVRILNVKQDIAS